MSPIALYGSVRRLSEWQSRPWPPGNLHPGAGDRSSKAFEKKRQGHQGYRGGEDVAKF